MGSSGSQNWFEEEPPLGAATTGAIRRLARRATATWPLWVGVAVAGSVALTVWRVRHVPLYEVTVVLRVSEGGVRTPGAEVAAGLLRARVNELAFTRARLTELAGRRPAAFKGMAPDPESLPDEIRRRTDVVITDDDFIEDRDPTDPPRSARIALSYRAATPEVAWTVAHDLAELIIGSTLSGQREAITRVEAAAESALDEAKAEPPAEGPSGLGPVLPEGSGPAAIRARLRASEQGVAEAQLSLHAAEEQQTLRFEMVNPGRIPTPPTMSSRLAGGVEALIVALLAAGLLAGAFDPRVLDKEDVGSLGLVPLGHLPQLPVAAGGGASEVGGASDRSSPRV